MKKYFLISPKIDFFLIGGGALFAYLLTLLLDIPATFDIVFWMFVLAFFVNSPHFMISYELFYSSAEINILKPDKFLFAGVVVPVFLFFILIYGFIFSSKLSFLFMLFTMFFLVGWHYIKQAYGCFIVYSAGNNLYYSTTEKNIIKYSLYPLWFFSFLKLFTSGEFKNYWGLEYHFFPILLPFATLMKWLSLLGIMAFLGLMGYRYFSKKALPNIIALTPIIVIFVWLSPVFWNEIYFYMIPFFHSLQYFLFSGAYTKNKIEKDQSGLKGWLLWWGGAFILGALFFEFIPSALDKFLPLATNITPNLFLISFIFFINIHHYFIDSVMWRGDNPNVRKYLKFKSV